MDRLTTDKPSDNLSALLNFAYAKDRRVVLSHANGKDEVELCEYIAEESRWKGCGLGRQAVEDGDCGTECDCVFTVLNLAAIQAAELRGRLMMIEDILGDTYDLDHLRELIEAERQGRIEPPLICYIGDTIYVLIDTLSPKKEMRVAKVTGFRRGSIKRYVIYRYKGIHHFFESSVPVDELGKTWFLSQEEAEAALAKDNNVLNKEEE